MQVSKEDNLAHVILATSDCAFLYWLSEGELRMMRWSISCSKAKPGTGCGGLWHATDDLVAHAQRLEWSSSSPK